MWALLHTTTIDPQTFADVLKNMTVASRKEDRGLIVTSGHHPNLGRTVVVQVVGDVVLVSEFPISVLAHQLRNS